MGDRNVNLNRIMLTKYFTKNKFRLIFILLSIVIGSATIAALVNLYMDIDIKMKQELRTYGTNVIIKKSGTSQNKSYLSSSDISRASSFLDKNKVVGFTPYLYGVADSKSQRFVIAGVDLKEFNKLVPYFRTVKKIPEKGFSPMSAHIGKALATKINAKPGDIIKVQNSLGTGSVNLKIISIFESGGVEDDQLITGISVSQKLFDKNGKADLIAVSYIGDNDDIKAVSEKAKNLNLKISPVFSISKSEGSILTKINSLTLFVSITILLSAILATAITLASLIYERRYEIGIKKAIGASDKKIVTELMMEATIAGIIGGLLGWLAGIGIAQVISLTLFNSLISVRIITVLITVLVALFITSVSSVIPIKRALIAEPASILRNE